MRRFLSQSWLILLILPVLFAGIPLLPDAAATENRAAANEVAVVRIGNRDVARLRGFVGGATPVQRARTAAELVDQLPDYELDIPVETKDISIGNERGIAFLLGRTAVFALMQSDLDPLSGQSLNDAAATAARNLSAALHVVREQRRPQTLMRGAALTLLATVAFAFALWLISRLKARIDQRLEGYAIRRLDSVAARGGEMTEQTMTLVPRLTGFVFLFAILVAAYLWFTFILRQFPYTEPWGNTLVTHIVNLLKELAAGAVSGAPGILAVIVIFAVTRLVVQLLNTLFRAIEEEKLLLPFMYSDTARATRWLVTAVIWLFALTIAYPRIPGSDSPAFQGISVIVGLMATFGSAGVVSQAMSGLMLVYSRALKPGEYVQVGETMGVVNKVGLLATKIETYGNEEVTIPNTVVIGNEITNYSRLAKTKGVTVTTTIQVGYDTPWRQVVAMLIQAAQRSSSIRKDIQPHVLQREFTDFHIKYELVAYTEHPDKRLTVINTLHSHILDVFNENEVQIMTPNFEGQPDHKVIVPKDRWFMPPARVEPK